jgi:hypothetical protein
VSPADMPADTRDPGAIEHEMEATRDRLADTIDQLVHRANPKTIAQREVAGIRSYFVDASGAPRTDNILKVVGAVAGFIVVMVVVRKVAK